MGLYKLKKHLKNKIITDKSKHCAYKNRKL